MKEILLLDVRFFFDYVKDENGNDYKGYYFRTSFVKDWDYVLVPDTRFPNEVDMMKNKFGAEHIRVVRPNFESPLTVEQQNHPSEVALDDYIPDCFLENSGDIDDLKETVNTWIKETIYA